MTGNRSGASTSPASRSMTSTARSLSEANRRGTGTGGGTASNRSYVSISRRHWRRQSGVRTLASASTPSRVPPTTREVRLR
ncbi:hypothetical protein ACVILE_001362 [Streptomyces sp. M18.1]